MKNCVEELKESRVYERERNFNNWELGLDYGLDCIEIRGLQVGNDGGELKSPLGRYARLRPNSSF